MNEELALWEEISHYLNLEWGDTEDLIIIEKSLKVLEIIKNHFKIAKPVGVSIEKNSVGIGGLIQIKDLTIEDYSLLKEVLL